MGLARPPGPSRVLVPRVLPFWVLPWVVYVAARQGSPYDKNHGTPSTRHKQTMTWPSRALADPPEDYHAALQEMPPPSREVRMMDPIEEKKKVRLEA